MKSIVMSILALGLVGLVSACGSADISPEAGQNLAVVKGCAACHAVDKTPKIGPSWVGLFGSQVELDDGSRVTADEAYLIESMKDPNAKIVQGYTKGSMPAIALTEDELNALVAYIKTVEQ
jgi:mono/diheme cytochrome c family protein